MLSCKKRRAKGWSYVVVCGVVLGALFQCGPAIRAQDSTANHLAAPGWWPTKGTASRADFVGPAVCAQCHAEKAASQKTTQMARTALPAAHSPLLRQFGHLSFDAGPYSFHIGVVAGKPYLLVSDGVRSVSRVLTWAFGTGDVGQSYLFELNGGFQESRASYFDTLKGLDFTPGRALTAPPPDIEEAMARPVPRSEVRHCFACHTTASTTSDGFDTRRLIPGITCEVCHGPGAKHATEMQAAQIAGTVEVDEHSIFDPARLNPADAVDFCGACHGTWFDTAIRRDLGVANVRVQPYRLENSRCWSAFKKGDALLTCTACHDPHERVEHNAEAYDAKCLSCHQSTLNAKAEADHPGSACKIATKNCVTCHMPKYEPPGMHFKFTDHQIRIVRANESYPD